MYDTQIQNVLKRDYSEEFNDALQKNLAGAYDRNFEDIANPAGGFCTERAIEVDALNLSRARKARRDLGMTALIQTGQQFKLPTQLKQLACNGQKFVVVQIGQILMIAEPINDLSDRPENARYKEELAASHFAIRQIEMDFSPHVEEVKYRQRIDARNTMLVVLQHGMRGGHFNRRDTSLAMMRLVVPDSSFTSLIWSANALNDEIAYALDWRNPVGEAKTVQEDRVTVTLKAGLIQKV